MVPLHCLALVRASSQDVIGAKVGRAQEGLEHGLRAHLRGTLERAEGARAFVGGLGALLWPERTLLFDDTDALIDTQAGQGPRLV